jgi:precorrin-2 dehydrogenase/sirohydrochlorin ferrochelatase
MVGAWPSALNVGVTRTNADRGFQYFPAFLDLVRKRVVVIGGGRVAAAKVRSLLPCGAEPLVVIAPEACSSIAEAAAAGRLMLIARGYRDGDLAGAALAFAATDDRSLNARVADEARRRGLPVLAVDDIPNCDFIAPALVRRGELVLAISTHGRSPALARRAREWLDDALPPHWGGLLEVAAAVRQRLGPLRLSISPEAWQAALTGPVEDLVRQGADEAAATLLSHTLRGSAAS